MRLKVAFRQLFKHSSKSQEALAREMMQDIQKVKFSEDDFKKKYRKQRDLDIKNISSLTEIEKEQKRESAKDLDNINMEVFNLAPLIKRKYEIAHQYMQDYLDALRKSMKKDK